MKTEIELLKESMKLLTEMNYKKFSNEDKDFLKSLMFKVNEKLSMIKYNIEFEKNYDKFEKNKLNYDRTKNR